MLKGSKSGRGRAWLQRAFSVAVLAAATGLVVQAGAQAATIKMGALLPLTGNDAVTGEVETNGINLAVKDINGSGGISGRDLHAEIADMAANPRTAVSAFQFLLRSEDNPQVVLTGFSSPTLAITPRATSEKVLLLNPWADSPVLEGKSKYLVNVIPLGDLQAKVLVHYAIAEKGSKTFAAIYRNDDYGRSIDKEIRKFVAAFGGKYVGGESFNPGEMQVKAQLTKIRALKPDAVYVISFGNETGTILKQAADLDMHPQWLGPAPFENPNTIKIGGGESEGALYVSPSTIDPASGQEFEMAKHFYAEYSKAHGLAAGQIPNTALSAYNATMLVGHVMNEVSKSGQPLTGSNIRERLMKTKFVGVYGPMDFQPNGTVIEPLAVKTVKNGKFTILKSFTLSQIEALK
ncbi:MAG: hypothetical protein EPN41_05010 [Candidimonas sp.]|nr:MAG: hypothetical protein EPN41_05010 [Candidimonas sp.]